jgi:hypothetical protein
MKYLSWMSFFLFVVLVSCKQSASESGSSSASKADKNLPVAEKYILHNQFAGNDTLIQKQRQAALSILEHRLKSVNPEMTNVLEKDFFVVDAFLRGNQMTFGAEVKGMWLDFKDNNTYAYGYYNENYGTGRYAYTTDNNLLLLIDNDERIKPQEFEVKYNNDALVLVGQATYGDNSMQIKSVRKSNYPEKPATEEWNGTGGDEE